MTLSNTRYYNPGHVVSGSDGPRCLLGSCCPVLTEHSLRPGTKLRYCWESGLDRSVPEREACGTDGALDGTSARTSTRRRLCRTGSTTASGLPCTRSRPTASIGYAAVSGGTHAFNGGVVTTYGGVAAVYGSAAAVYGGCAVLCGGKASCTAAVQTPCRHVSCWLWGQCHAVLTHAMHVHAGYGASATRFVALCMAEADV
eukprot:3577524-Rhodomonas_salina.1